MLAGLESDETRARAHLDDALTLAQSPETRRKALARKENLEAVGGDR